MFNGLVRDIVKVTEFDGKRLCVAADFSVGLGDSVALNGACLSVTEVFDGGFVVELSSESSGVLALENYAAQSRLHAERAMVFGERVDGHLVQGHIDALGVIERIETRESGNDFFVRLPQNAARLIAPKGSVCVEGISLTVNEITGDLMRLSIIPLTLKETLFGEFKQGRRVQIETDLFARYVARLLAASKEFGAQNGGLENGGERLTQETADFLTQMY